MAQKRPMKMGIWITSGPRQPTGLTPHLLVELHHFLAAQLGIVLVLLVDLLDARLQPLELPRLPQLPDHERVGERSNDDGERDDGEAEVGPQPDVEHEQAVGHRFGDDLVPEQCQQFHAFSRLLHVVQVAFPRQLLRVQVYRRYRLVESVQEDEPALKQ